MSLDKAIKHGKEYRKKYYDSRRFDYSCRNHGGGRTSKPCPYCENNRLFNSKKKKFDADEQIKDFMNYGINDLD